MADIIKYYIIEPTQFINICKTGTTTNFYVGGHLTVSGNTYLQNNLYVTGDTHVYGVMYSGDTPLTEIFAPIGSDTFVTGATLNGTTFEIGRNQGLPNLNTDLSQLINTSVTGLTFNAGNYDLTLSQINGEPDIITNLAALASDVFVMSGVYDASTGIVTYTTNSGTTFQVSGFTTGMTDSYTTNAYIVGNEIRYDNNIQGSNLYSVDLTQLLSGKTDNTTFYSYTSNTQNILNTKIDGGVNVGGGHEVFSAVTGTDMVFRTLSGGSNTTISTIGEVIKIDTSDGYVTGGNVSGTNLILNRSGGLSGITIDTSAYFDNTDNYVTGATMNGDILELSRSGGLSNVTVDLSQFVDSGSDGVVSGATMNGNTLELSRTEGLGLVTVDLSQFINTDNYLSTGGMVGNTLVLNRTDALSAVTVDMSQFIDDGFDGVVSGGTVVGSDLQLHRTEGLSDVVVDLSPFVGGSDGVVSGATMNGNTLELSRTEGLGLVSVDLSQFINTDNYLATGSMVGNTLVLNRTDALSAVTVDMSQFVDDGFDGVVSGGTVSGSDLELHRTQGLSDVIIDLSPFVGGSDGVVSGATMNGNTLELSRTEGLGLVSVDLSQFINTDNYLATGSMVGNTMVLNRTDALSAVTIDLSQFIDDGFDGVVSGATLNGNTLELSRTQGLSDVTVDLTPVIGDDGVVSGATMNGNTLELSRTEGLGLVSVDLSQFINTDNYLATGSMVGNTLVLNRTDALSAVTVDLSQFVDGGGGSGSTIIYSATAPVASTYSGNTWVRTTDYEVFFYDVTRGKWLSSNTNSFEGSRAKNNQTNVFLRTVDGSPYNLTPYVIPKDSTITGIMGETSTSDTFKILVSTGTTLPTDIITQLQITSNTYGVDMTLNINAPEEEHLYLYMSGTTVDYPKTQIYYKYRG
jgi:hypothetical protein